MAITPYAYALKLLTARAYTIRDLRRKLVQKGFAAEESSETVERLISSGLLNDERYAEEFARQRLMVSGASVRRVEQLLAGKGISREVAKAAVARVAAYEEVDVLGSMERIARKKLMSMGDLEPLVLRRRVFGFLARKGYDLEDIRQIVSRILP
jgi:regulatory protein